MAQYYPACSQGKTLAPPMSIQIESSKKVRTRKSQRSIEHDFSVNPEPVLFPEATAEDEEMEPKKELEASLLCG